jgi:membrane associated rhomboid family serine protease
VRAANRCIDHHGRSRDPSGPDCGEHPTHANALPTTGRASPDEANPLVTETHHCYRHPNRETLVSCSECGRYICEECMNFAPVGIRCPEHATVGPGAKTSAKRQVRTAGRRASSLAAPATVALVVVNVAVYLVTVFQGAGISSPGGRFFADGGLYGPAVSDGDWYRLLTAMFLHASVLHIAFNMFALYWLGSVVEEAIGSLRFLLVYFVSGLAGSAGALLLDPTQFTVGASGAIWGIMGALLVLEYMTTGSFAGQAMGLIMINLVITFTIPNISVGGHLGGLAGGIVATYVLLRMRDVQPSWLAGSVVAAIGVAAVVVSYVRVESYF